MTYIQLSSLSLPASAPRTTVFPFLLQEQTLYRFALLVCDRNRMAQAFLRTAGFVSQDNSHSKLSIALPGGDANDLWTFFFVSDTAPIQILDDQLPTSDPKSLPKYLSFGTFTQVVSGVMRPASVDVVENAVAGFRETAEFELLGVDFLPPASGWEMKFSANPNTTDQTAVSFIFQIQSVVPETDQRFELPLALLANSDAGTWGGSKLQVKSLDLEGGPDDSFPLGGGTLVTTTNGGADLEGVLSFDWQPSVDLRFSFLKSSLFQVGFAIESLRVRFRKQDVGVFLLENATNDPVRVKISLKAPLIMAPVGTATPEALSIVIPLVDLSGESQPKLEWNLTLSLDSDWNSNGSPLAIYEDRPSKDRWQFGVDLLSLDLPLNFSDRSRSTALGGLQFSLAELIGDLLGSVNFALHPKRQPAGNNQVRLHDKKLTIPVDFDVSIGSKRFSLELDLAFDLETLRLASNRLNFTFPAAPEGDPVQVVDLGAFGLLIPYRDPDNSSGTDGYIDFEKREFVLQSKTANPWLVVPGAFTSNENEGERGPQQYDFSNRLLFELERKFNPDEYVPGKQDFPGTDVEKQCALRINGSGVSFHAKIDSSHVATVFRGDGLSPKVDVRPQKERKNKNSHIVLVDNAIREAAIFAEMDVPGTDDLVAAVEIGLRQKKRGEPPVVYATVDLDTTDGKPLAQLTAGYVQLSIDDFHDWTLTWNTKTNDWDLKLPTDLSLSVAPRTSSAGGLDQLRDKNAIKVRDLDLMNLHKGAGSIELNLDRSVEFDCLDGMFGVRLNQLGFGWGDAFVFTCETAEFTFKNPGAFDVTIEVGGVHLEFSGGSKLKMRNPSRIGIDAAIGDSVRFRGAVAWVDNDREHYFAAAGTLTIEGLPEATTLLKIGTGVKDNGQIVPNIVLYGAADYEITLFAGVVAKNFGAGIGINNRLTGIGDRPNAEQVLANIDSIDPSRLEGWEFVRRNGFYLSIVGTTIIASNEGGNSSDNAYVAALVLSIDLDLNVIAAGKLWLYSSVDFVRKRENWQRPALVGAITLIPRERLITAAFESKPNPAVESNDRIAEILNKGHVKLSFLMSPKLVDFFLQDVSYRDKFLGVDMNFRGSLRFAIYQGTVLLRAGLMVTGQFDKTLSEGPGGFAATGDVAVLVEFGGLVSGRGLAAYGLIAISISLRVKAWIKIEFSFTIGCGRWKKRISFSKTFNLANTRLDLGLRGAIAFNESGQVGFDGQLAISVSICGYRLSIAPSLRFNDGVITEVRGRVAAFEERIEAARQELLGGGQKASHLSAAAASLPLGEEWLLYFGNGWIFLVPRAGSKWLTPNVKIDPEVEHPIFTDDVRNVQIFLDGGNEPVLTLLTPWDAKNQEKLTPAVRTQLAARLEELDAIMSETAVADTTDEPSITQHNAFRTVADPRFKSTGREYWTEEDLVRLPDYALPIQLRSVEEVLSAGTVSAESDLGQLVDFLFWRQRAIRVQRHKAGDREAAEKIAHNRGAVGQLFLEELGGLMAAPSADSPWVARPTATDDPKLKFGWIFQYSENGFDISKRQDFDRLTFKVTRGESTTPIESVVCPVHADEINQTRRFVQTAPPRQQFVVDTAADSQSEEQGRVIVKLPLVIEPEFLQDRIETVSHFRVYRRFPWQDQPELIADQLRPDLTYIDANDDIAAQQPVVVVGPFLFTDEFRVSDRKLVLPGLTADATQIEYRLQLVAVGETPSATVTASNSTLWPLVRLHVPSPNLFPSDLGIVLPVESLVGDVRSNPEFARFALVATGSEGTPLASIPHGRDQRRPIETSDFELWAEPVPLGMTGFYAGAAEGTTETGGGVATTTVNQLSKSNQSIRTRTIDGLLRLSVAADTQDGWFRVNTSAAFPLSGFGYRLFVRPTVSAAGDSQPGTHAFGPVFPLDAFLAREQPNVISSLPPNLPRWETHPRLRPIRQIEFIPIATIRSVREQAWHWSPLVVCERELDENIVQHAARETRRQFGLDWILESRDQGGVEILLRDVDDTALQSRVLCETLTASDFQRRIPDFRNGSLWQLTRLERTSRLEWKYAPVPLLANLNVDIPLQFIYQDVANPVLGQLSRRKTELDQVLGSSQPTWTEVFNAAKNWLTAIYEFQKSPINLNDADVQTTIRRIKALLRYGFTGRANPAIANSDLDESAIKRIDDECFSLLREIEDTQPERLQLDDTTEEQQKAATRTLVDLDLAKRLAAIIRRREVIAEELFDSSTEAPPSSETRNLPLSDPEWLPRGDRFEKLRTRQAAQTVALGGTLPRSAALLAMFARQSTILWPQGTDKSLSDANDRLLSLANFKQADKSDPMRPELGAGIVANASGMTLVLNCVKRALSTIQGTLIRRPHHQVSVSRGGNVQRTPESTKLESLLPDEVRNQPEITAVSVPPYQEVIAYFNILERMGFALDIAATDSLGELLSQSELMELLRQADLPTCMLTRPASMDDHIIQIVAGREPDSELFGAFPDPDGQVQVLPYVGHSFVKLAVIPKRFYDLLTSQLHDLSTDDPQTTTVAKAANRDELKDKWLGIRNIDPGTDEKLWVAWIEQLGRVADYLKGASTSASQTIRVEVRDRRWVSVPAVNHRSHVDWIAPDTRGHRYEAVARVVSRYEPIIRWALGDFRLSRWPNLADVEPEDFSIRRLVTEQLTVGFVADVSENLPVSIYPHPEFIQFGYLIPSAGARSLSNVISAVRTAYQGVSTVFRYELRDHDDDARKWAELMAAVVCRQPVQGDDSSLLDDPPPFLKPAPQLALTDVRLFRHERLLTLRNMPHFYQYRLHVRSHYDADYLFPQPADVSEGDHPARREPRVLAWRRPLIESDISNNSASEGTVTVELRLTRTGDLLTPEEWSNSPPLEPLPFTVIAEGGGTESRLLSADQLPEPAMSYQLYYLANQPDTNARENYYVAIAELLMPWHQAYKPRDGQLPLNPWFRSLDSRVVVANSDEWPSVILGQSQHGGDANLDKPAYVVQLRFKVHKPNGDPELLFAEPHRRFLQVCRNGKLSEPIGQE